MSAGRLRADQRRRLALSADSIRSRRASVDSAPNLFSNRLYCGRSGKCLVHYDNETGKGDERHYGDREETHFFTSMEQLLTDFRGDCSRLAGWRWL